MAFTENREPFGEYSKLSIKHNESSNEIEIIPEMGARLNHFQVNMHGESIDIIDGYSDSVALAEESRSKSSFLAPYPNRVADGQYEFSGKSYQLDINKPSENNSIHGFVSDQEFEVISSEIVDDYYEVVLHSVSEGAPGYPFPFSVVITYRFGGVWLQVETELTNIGDCKIPAGFGWHPYFKIGESIDRLRLSLPKVEKIEVDERLIPIGEKIEYSNFSALSQIGDIELDTGFHMLGTQKEVQLFDESHGVYVTISMVGEGYDYVQLYIPPCRESIAIEPMTCAANAFNNGWGLKTLKKDESLKASFTIVAS